jgi:uncharacterized protein YkwD
VLKALTLLAMLAACASTVTSVSASIRSGAKRSLGTTSSAGPVRLLATATAPKPAPQPKPAAPARVTAPPTPLEAATMQAINVLRISHQLHPLRLSPLLRASSLAHTQEMAEHGYFEHASFGGGPQSWWKRIDSFYPQGNFSNWDAGENLIWSEEALSASEIITAWMNSPEHRSDLLDPAWREAGVSGLRTHALGVYAAFPQVTILTVDFGARS